MIGLNCNLICKLSGKALLDFCFNQSRLPSRSQNSNGICTEYHIVKLLFNNPIGGPRMIKDKALKFFIKNRNKTENFSAILFWTESIYKSTWFVSVIKFFLKILFQISFISMIRYVHIKKSIILQCNYNYFVLSFAAGSNIRDKIPEHQYDTKG